MTKKVFSVAVAALAIAFLSMPAQAVTASAANLAPGNSVFLGNHDIAGPIKGDLERTIQFDVVPGEEFTFDMTLRNTEDVENTANIVLRLDMPNGAQWVMYNEDMILQGLETFVYNYAEYIPGNLQLFGRYTLELFIDGRQADSFQFDINSRTQIVVRWDDGALANAYAWYDAGNKWAIRGCMPDGAIIDEIGVHILAENDPYWPWPDGVHQDIEVQLYDNTGAGGYPGTMLYSAVTNGGTSGDAIANPGMMITTSAFFVANNQLDPYPTCEGQGVDVQLNHYDQMWAEIGGEWQPYYGISGDLMIWAIGHVGSQTITIGNPPVE